MPSCTRFLPLWLLFTSLSVQANEQGVIWQGDAIEVKLTLKHERRINFPEPIADLDVPAAIEALSQIVLSPDGSLHWTAETAFKPHRVLATSITGSLFQLDISASTRGENTPLNIIDPKLSAGDEQWLDPSEQEKREAAAERLLPDFLKGGAAGRQGQPSYVALARFALAHYIGPERLIPDVGATQVVVRPITAQQWLRVQSAQLVVQPLAQWQVGTHYVTAIGVYNQSAQAVDFDPRALRGDIAFVAPLNVQLQPRGSGHNGTVWAVVTSRPFNQAIGG